MKIKRLEIENFRNHSHSILELEPFNVLRGSNFAGKSSIAQAISMCVTPTTTGLDATGRGFTAKIKRGAPKAVLTADIQGKTHLVQRIVTLNTNTTGRTDSSKCIDDPEWHPSPFEKQLDSNRAALAVCLNTDRYFTMDEKDQKSLLAKLALPKEYDFAEETMDAVDKALGEGAVDFDGEPFAVIDKAYKLLYAERQVVNRQVKEFVVPDTITATGVDVTTLQGGLADARERQKRLSSQRDAEISKNHEANIKQTRLNEKIYQLNEKVQTEEARIEGLIGFLSEAKLKDFQKIAAGAATLKALEEERVKVQAKLERRKERVALYSKMVIGEGGECPTCYRPTDSNFVEEATAQAKTDLEKTQKQYAEVFDKMKALGDVAGAVKAIADHHKVEQQKIEMENVITEKSKLLNDAKAELNKLPTVTEVLIPFVKPLDEVDAEITALLAKLQPALAAEERKKEIATKTEQLKKLQAKATSVDTLVKVFDKDGIKADLLKEHIGGFTEKMNLVMSAFGYSVTLDIEPEFQFVVTDTNNVLTPVKELSGSEQLMFAVALQCAVSKAAGIGIVVADRLDTFLPAQRSKANKVLYMLVNEGTLDQVFAIMSDESETVPPLPNSAFFLVEAGAVRRL